MSNNGPYKEDTKIAHFGVEPEAYHGVISPPVVRSSSIAFPSLESYEGSGQAYVYARVGTPLSAHFERAIAELEGGHGAISAPSGLSAIATTLMAFTNPGDHILVTDALYDSARHFFDHHLGPSGVEVEYYDPLIGGDIAARIKKTTRMVYMESPGSGTFEVQDVPAIVAAAKARNVLTVFDNSWASGVLYKPLSHGVDITVSSATKYIGGHSDLMLGVAVAATPELYKTLKARANYLGVCAGSEELYLALRGLRTIKIRLRQHQENLLKVASWLRGREEVTRIFCPALPDDPGHALWLRDFSGHNGLLSILLKPAPKKAVAAFTDGLRLFRIAHSWGGFESLLQPQSLAKTRKAVPWTQEGALLRLHIGLEDPADLIADLAAGFERFNRVREG